MKRPYHIFLGVVLLLTAAVAHVPVTRGQQNISFRLTDHENAIYRLSQSHDVVMNLAGTTPVRNWCMTAHGLSGEAIMLVHEDRLADITSLRFSLPVHNLKGDGDGMDRDCYTALKAEKYPTIDFELLSTAIESYANNSYLVRARGNLSVAGVTREVTLFMHGILDRNSTIRFTGSEELKMSDYHVERPSLLLGLIHAGDAMTLTYSLIFTKAQQ